MQVTISHIFYNQHSMLPIHQEAWDRHPPNSVRYTLIDDCSPIPIKTPRRRNLDVYRVQEDIPWNISGARNLAYHVAQTDWVLCADVDHVVTASALESILALDLSDENVAYIFARQRPDGTEGCRAIINCLMARDKYFEIGGYDEDFSGHYGREETFFDHCLVHNKIRVKFCDHIILEWHPKLGGTSGLIRDKSHNAVIYDQKIQRLQNGIYRNGPILRFNWLHMR